MLSKELVDFPTFRLIGEREELILAATSFDNLEETVNENPNILLAQWKSRLRVGED